MIRCKVIYNSNEEEINTFLQQTQGTFISLYQNILPPNAEEDHYQLLTPRLVTTILYNEPNIRGGMKLG